MNRNKIAFIIIIMLIVLIIEGDNAKKYTKVTRQVRKLCDKNNIEFLFITVRQSQWSVTKDKHIRDVVNYHKKTENQKGN